MLGSTEDAEDVLQEVFVNAYRAMLADEREINLRPWLYRIARNRCLNHLRKPTADAQESMDMVPAVEAASTAEKVHNREEFRQLLCRRQQASRDPALGAAAARDGRALLRGNRRRDGHHRALGQVAAGASADLPRRGEPGAPADLRRGPARALRSRRGPAQGLRPGATPRSRVRRMRRLPLPGPLQREGAGGAVPRPARWSPSKASSSPSSASAERAGAPLQARARAAARVPPEPARARPLRRPPPGPEQSVASAPRSAAAAPPVGSARSAARSAPRPSPESSPPR